MTTMTLIARMDRAWGLPAAGCGPRQLAKIWSVALSLFLVMSARQPAVARGQKGADATLHTKLCTAGDSSTVEVVPGEGGATGAPLPKVLHAEPLYIDLIRDLGARRGEREWNVGLGITDRLTYDTYGLLVEYEWAPRDRLGLEVELPFTFTAPNGTAGERLATRTEAPGHRLESLKTAAQWTFLVSPRHGTSLALGYINELALHDLRALRRDRLFSANVFNPFFVAAKRWGAAGHSLLYTGPRVEIPFTGIGLHTAYDANLSAHYVIRGTRNFAGLEVNSIWAPATGLHTVLRPQLRVAVTENLLVGIVAGVPVQKNGERLSSFARLIWEPPPHHRHRRL